MYFKVVGKITGNEIIAVDASIREIARLRKIYGLGRWKKMKGTATVRLFDSLLCKAEIHWYEAHGIGKKEMKIKYILAE